jgi:hypothetical protein
MKNLSNETAQKIFNLFKEASILAQNEGFSLESIVTNHNGTRSINATYLDDSEYLAAKAAGKEGYLNQIKTIKVERNNDEWLPNPINPSLAAKTTQIFS